MTLLATIAPAASPGYLDVTATLARADRMIDVANPTWSPLVWGALAVRCEAHAEHLRATQYDVRTGWLSSLAAVQFRQLRDSARLARGFESGARS